MKQTLWIAAIATTGLIACAQDEDTDVPADEDVQEPASGVLRRNCGTIDLTDAEMAADQARMAFGETRDITASHVIPVYWHNIRTSAGGGIVATATQISRNAYET